MSNRFRFQPLLFLVVLLLPGPSLAQSPANLDSGTESMTTGGSKASSTQYTADPLDTSWNHNRGDIVTRFSIDFTAVAGLNEGEVNVADSLIIGLAGGVGYFPTHRLSADIDLSTSLQFGEDESGFTRFVITPGTRIYPIPQAYVRLGIPFVLTSPSSINGLLGAGYEIPVGESTSLVGEIALTYPFTGDGTGTITVGGGTTFTF